MFIKFHMNVNQNVHINVHLNAYIVIPKNVHLVHINVHINAHENERKMLPLQQIW